MTRYYARPITSESRTYLGLFASDDAAWKGMAARFGDAWGARYQLESDAAWYA